MCRSRLVFLHLLEDFNNLILFPLELELVSNKRNYKTGDTSCHYDLITVCERKSWLELSLDISAAFRVATTFNIKGRKTMDSLDLKGCLSDQRR
jgi:hypothetical protein